MDSNPDIQRVTMYLRFHLSLRDSYALLPPKTNGEAVQNGKLRKRIRTEIATLRTWRAAIREGKA